MCKPYTLLPALNVMFHVLLVSTYRLRSLSRKLQIKLCLHVAGINEIRFAWLGKFR